MTAVSRTYNIPKYRISEMVAELDKIQKRYKITYDFYEGEESTITIGDEFGYDMKITFVNVTVFINVPGYQIDGWDYLGCIKDEFMDGEGLFTSHGNSFAAESGISLHEIMKEHNNIPCEHCGRRHVSRKIGHMFRKHEDGEIRTFGSTCAKKYFGINFLSLLNKFERIFNRLGGFEDKGIGAYKHIFDSELFYHITHYSIANFGYVPASVARYDETKQSTINDVQSIYSILCSNNEEHKKQMREKLSNHVSDFNTFKDMEWVEKKESYTEFENNILVLRKRFDDNMMTWRNLGLYVWVIFALIFKPEEEKKEKVNWNNDPDYTEGCKIRDIDLEIVNVSGFDSMYGWTYIYTFKGPENVRFKWFTGNNIVGDEWQGKVVHMNSGSVKKIEKDPKWGTSVVLTRCRMKK